MPLVFTGPADFLFYFFNYFVNVEIFNVFLNTPCRTFLTYIEALFLVTLVKAS